MINDESLKAVAASTFSRLFCKPLYDSFCFSRIPKTIESLLLGPVQGGLPNSVFGGVEGPFEVVVLFFVDGFGWQLFQKYADRYPFLKRFIEKGVVSKITSQFPSTTAAHVTCLNTGLPVGHNALYEWFAYEPLIDKMIAPLLYSYAGDKKPGTLESSNLKPAQLYPNETIYQDLKRKGVQSFVMQNAAIAHSTYSQMMFKGAENVPYQNLAGGVAEILRLAAQNRGPQYFYLYFGDVDSMAHRHGLDSPQVAQAIETCWRTLEDHFWSKIGSLKKKVACISIADHGIIPVDPKTTIYLNLQLPKIVDKFKKMKDGKPIAPAGSCRDFFLHIEESHLDSVQQELRVFLNGKAEVYQTSELIKLGFFGQEPLAKAFLERVGNLVILPYANEGVWWYEKGRFEQNFYAAHGGLTREEMETAFLFIEKI